MTKKQFFKAQALQGLALAFDDVRLLPGYSNIMPAQVKVATQFSRNIKLKIPIVSSAMDTVTEAAMAIEMAKLGGLGIIHRGLDPLEQAKAVAHVKMHMNGLIVPPIAVRPTDTMEDILKLKKERDYQFHSFLVTDSVGKLVGMVTRHHFDLCEDHSTPVSTLMTTGLTTAPPQTSPERAHELMKKHQVKHLPLVNADGTLVGLYVFSDIKRLRSGNATAHNLDAKGQLIVGAAIGTGAHEYERAKLLIDRGVDVLVIDSAHGHSKNVHDTLRHIKKRYGSKVDVVVGNIAVAEAARRLVNEGADGIKVGVGPGSICTTRIVAGIGQPQLTAVYECAEAVAASGIPVCADGGIRNSGDIAIAIGAGAYSVMLGGLLAGTDETPGEVIAGYKTYRGMGSPSAMRASKASRERYRQEVDGYDVSKLIAEGVDAKVPYRGPVARQLEQLVGGLRLGMGYVGVSTIGGMRAKANFVRITGAGMAESRPHDVIITEVTDHRRS